VPALMYSNSSLDYVPLGVILTVELAYREYLDYSIWTTWDYLESVPLEEVYRFPSMDSNSMQR
jgi:hypothetical protein